MWVMGNSHACINRVGNSHACTDRVGRKSHACNDRVGHSTPMLAQIDRVGHTTPMHAKIEWDRSSGAPILEVFPYIGNLPIVWKSSYIVADFPYMGSLPT